MCAIIIPQGYRSALDIRQTEVAIKEVKDTRGKTGIFAEADRIYGWKIKI